MILRIDRTGADLSKLFPAPPAVFNGPHPETGDELQVKGGLSDEPTGVVANDR